MSEINNPDAKKPLTPSHGSGSLRATDSMECQCLTLRGEAVLGEKKTRNEREVGLEMEN